MSHRYVLPELIGNNPIPVSTPTAPTQNASPVPGISAPLPQVEVVFPWGNPNINSPLGASGQPTLPPYFRSVSSVIPATADISTNSGVPLGLVVTPAQVTNSPVIDCSESTVIRCQKCSSYLSPYSRVESDYRTYICPMCGTRNGVAVDTYNTQPLLNRPELSNTVYDLVAPRSYVVLPNFQPAFVIIVDISIPAMTCGFTAQYLTSIKAILPSLNENIYLSLITISDRVSIYDFAQQKEIVIPDLTDLPQINAKPARIGDIRSQIEEVFDAIISTPPSPTATGHCLPDGLLAAAKIVHGKSAVLFVGVVNIPTRGTNVLHPRDTNVDELALLKLPPDNSGKFFRDISVKLNEICSSYHLFCATWQSNSIDLASMAVPAGLTGGTVHYYGQFSQEACSRMHLDLFNELTTDYFYCASLRLRCSSGVKVSKIHGNLMVKNRDLVNFPVLIPDKAVTFELAVDGEIRSHDALFQLALLWTTVDSRRMIRVFTFALPVTSDVNQIRSNIDEGALTAIEAKKAIFCILSKGREVATGQIRSDIYNLVNHSVRVSSMYHTSHAIILSPITAVPCENGADGRMNISIFTRSASINELLLWIYPRMFAIDAQAEYAKTPLPLAADSFNYGNVFLFHTNDKIYFWVSKNVSVDFLQNVFGVSSFDQLPSELPQLQTPENQNVQALMNECWNLSGKYLSNEIIPQEDHKEVIISRFLVDSTPNNDVNAWTSLVRAQPH
ncbi:Sec23/Sec24 trunk domain containing protein [Tritrichomonas foetus]|uniref:Sec23/Sec24 trunk domain containing protein n=1 Tax=Tritrichomonas foetus TaxID=1144522 RepID=A0A1J4JWZ6_9EUKA|nr:Sec23/Sec24 trunk domain containing protein [Tritrichomonas foetus]|eukprot:OHT02060.1 Sec23/Sec24 trunk domain containing protein [Tritrichomonas foetus]